MRDQIGLDQQERIPKCVSCGYDCGGYRAALDGKGITPCIAPRKNRIVQHVCDAVPCRERRHIATRCADIFMGAITRAAAAYRLK